jgi:hypothetical protein
MKDKKAYWIGGTITAGLGVALVRLLSPELAGVLGSVAAAVGYTLVVVGITIIAFGTRRKKSEAFITRVKDAKDRERR